jgi:hypothetical protein
VVAEEQIHGDVATAIDIPDRFHVLSRRRGAPQETKWRQRREE